MKRGTNKVEFQNGDPRPRALQAFPLPPSSSSCINSFALLVIITLLIYIAQYFFLFSPSRFTTGGWHRYPQLRSNQHGVLVPLDAAFDEGIVNLS
mmetsp:Transcript_34134/g.67870  ORF Transcript_34134/g.67870 Transcript_34134/m.67870 type:complete len:95 (-) Transcript_34134:98-382(-)